MVGRVGVEPTTLKRTDLQSAAFADSLPTQVSAVRWKQPQTPLLRFFNEVLVSSKAFSLPIAPILWRDRRHRRFFLFLKGVLVYALIHQWWIGWGTIPQPSACKADALPKLSYRPILRFRAIW